MRRILVLTLVAGLLAGLVASAPAGAAPLKGLQDDDLLSHLSDVNPFYAELVGLGVQVQRSNLDWANVAKKRPSRPADPSDSAYDWSGPDRVVDAAARFGIRVQFTLWRRPGWSRPVAIPRGKPYDRNMIPPARAEDLRDFVIAASRRYERRDPGTVGWLELWNEPNTAPFFGNQLRPDPAPVRYAKILDAAWVGLRRARSPWLLLAGALSPGGENSAKSTAPVDFVERMRLPGGRRPRFDLISVHPYALGPPPAFRRSRAHRANATGAVDLGSYPAFAQRVRRTYPGVGMWVSEFGLLRDDNAHVTPVPTLRAATRWLAYAYRRMTSVPGTRAIVQYQLNDQPTALGPGGRITSWQSGLRSADGVTKPVEAAFRALGEARPSLDSVAPATVAVPAATRPPALPDADQDQRRFTVDVAAPRTRLTFSLRGVAGVIDGAAPAQTVDLPGPAAVTVDVGGVPDGAYRLQVVGVSTARRRSVRYAAVVVDRTPPVVTFSRRFGTVSVVTSEPGSCAVTATGDDGERRDLDTGPVAAGPHPLDLDGLDRPADVAASCRDDAGNASEPVRIVAG